MNTNQIVAKLWSLANVLRDDGVSYNDYVTELTYILFLKMAEETGAEAGIPEEYRWKSLTKKSGVELLAHYTELLLKLGAEAEGRIGEIYARSSSTVKEPANLEKIIKTIDAVDWYSADKEDLGDLYEGLLEKNANDTKNGAGQYFTPRVLIDMMVELVKPQPMELCNDPAAGTFGFMIAASRYVREHSHDLEDLTQDEADFHFRKAFSGVELVQGTHRLALMNAMLHDLNSEIIHGDTLSSLGAGLKGFDVVLANPPFGTKRGGEQATRDDLTYPTSNKQLNFLQHIYRSLKRGGRAAVVLPDNVLFADGDGKKIRADLMNKCDVHTILRLPTGIFYAPGVKTNVLFFKRGTSDKGNTHQVWFYDLRSDMPSFGKRTPLLPSHFEAFKQSYEAEDRSSVNDPRLSMLTREQIRDDYDDSLDLGLLKVEDDSELLIDPADSVGASITDLRKPSLF